MSKAFLEIDHVDKSFPLKGGGEYIALKGINLKVKTGEFVSLIGHSGCGKSTLLNIIAGFDRASTGGVVLEDKEIVEPGPDRMVVFQNYSLLPWLTVRKNVALAVNRVMRDLPASDRNAIIENNIKLVGLTHAAHRKPSELSGGMKQRVAIARALALRPKIMLLDEPFGALDALSRGNLQEQLMAICQETGMTCIMVTHDVDEALLLSDRVIMLTNGPEARIGQILDVAIPRPRKRLEVVNHPSYYAMRNEIIYFLNQQKRAKRRKAQLEKTVAKTPAIASPLGLEVTTLNLGFIPLTDAAPFVVAQEKGFFKEMGFDDVILSREPSWKAIAEGITSGRLQGAHMLAGMPLALSLGMGDATPVPVVRPMVLSRNGNAITLDRRFLDQGVRTLADLKAAISAEPDQVHTFGMVHPSSMHNLMLRYWLAAGGIDPDQDVRLQAIPPAQMVANLKSGNIDGYCVGDPWNNWAIREGLGYAIATDADIWPGHPEKVLGMPEAWVNQHPKTAIALIKALLKACQYCDDRRNRHEIATLLARPEYVGVAVENILPGFAIPYDLGTGADPVHILRFNRFYVEQSNYPSPDEGLWVLTQLARWGLTVFPKNWREIIERLYRVDLFSQAIRDLGWPPLEPNILPLTLFDDVVFDAKDPIAYLEQFAIRHPILVEEVDLDIATSQAISASQVA
ncbi:MAG: ABC transporter substrate-binding protein [Synechococcales cyanobacterium CRU_2_2]|nr:ABC transporter substrate-binding protein [Synechococcales cyanobacterium CRU_2_2]